MWVKSLAVGSANELFLMFTPASGDGHAYQSFTLATGTYYGITAPLVAAGFYNIGAGDYGYADFAKASTINQWRHYAMVRSAGTISQWIHGESLGSPQDSDGTLDNTVFTATEFQFGGFSDYLTQLGQIRITPGVALYSGDTIPVPTAPFIVP
jgi:hypothetical protein